MVENNFKLENASEVKLFEDGLKKYYEKKTIRFPYLSYLNLIDWFNYCQDRESNGRLFTSVLDIKLNFVYLDILYTNSKVIFYERLNKNADSELFLNDQNFSDSLDLLDGLTNYVIKFRALLDKIMGLLVLVYAPVEYDKYRRAKSRKRKFKKIFNEYDLPLKINIDYVFSFLENFDKKYRTPEIHASGSIRKFVLLSANVSYDEIFNIQGESWHGLIYIISEIDSILKMN